MAWNSSFGHLLRNQTFHVQSEPSSRCAELNPKEFPKSDDIYFYLVIIASRYLSGFESASSGLP